MKKYIIVITLLMLLSCNNDNQLSEPADLSSVNTANSTQSKSADEIDAMFAAYVHSEIYRETKELIHQFTTDLNGLVIPADADMIQWVSKNIHQTNFRDIAEARQRWIQLTESQKIEIQQFAPVYEYIANAPLAEAKYYTHKWLIQNIKQNTNSSCVNRLNRCINTATENYIKSVSLAITTKGLYGAKEEVIREKGQFDYKVEGCTIEFEKCLKN